MDETLVMDEDMDFEQKRGLNRQYSKQDIDAHRALGGNTRHFPFLLAVPFE